MPPKSLVVSNTYDPLWRVMVEGRELSPQPACYLASAYTVDRVGEYDLTLEFVGQRYQWFAFALSGLAYGATMVALAVCLLCARRRRQGVSLRGDAQHATRLVNHGR